MTHPTGSLDSIQRTPQNHFRLHFYAAVFRLIYQLQRIGHLEEESMYVRYPFLAGYLDEMRRYMPPDLTWTHALAWWPAEIAIWEQETDSHLPLRALSDQGAIGFEGRVALVLIGIVEEDSRFGSLFAELHQPLAGRRPSLELTTRLLAAGDLTADDPAGLLRTLLSAGLVDVTDRTVPRSEWELYIPGVLWDSIRGVPLHETASWFRHHTPDELTPLSALVLPDDLLSQLSQLPALVSKGKARAIVLRGMRGSERLEAIGAVARALGQGILEVESTALQSERHKAWLGPLCAATRSIPVISHDLAPGETAEVPELTGYRGPVGVVMGMEGGLKGALAERALTLTLPAPTMALRTRYWQQALDGHPAPDLTDVSARFHMPGGYIRQVGAMATARSALNQRDEVTMGDIQDACRDLNRQMLDTLATRLEARGSWDDLVISPAAAAKLRELERRCRHRDRLMEHLSPMYSGEYLGVRALFDGPSGTGKTLAARTLAAVLGMDIYRLDLASVVNKYIGETEKNLSQVLSRAEELDVILLLDEGDALLGKRSDVKSSNDRYANMETNYLLQKLEHYQGIVLVTTNAGENIDRAFQRRMDVVINFMPPQPQERGYIWKLHLSLKHQVDAATLDEVAVRCNMTGGQIRNACLHATLLALDRNTPVGRRELVEAIQSEYMKAGQLCPLPQPR